MQQDREHRGDGAEDLIVFGGIRAYSERVRPIALLIFSIGVQAGVAEAAPSHLQDLPSEACALVRTPSPASEGSVAVSAGQFLFSKPDPADKQKIVLITSEGEATVARSTVLSTDLVRCLKAPACFKASRKTKTFRIVEGAVRDFGHLEANAAQDVAGILRTKSGSTFVAVRLTSEENVLVRLEGGGVTAGSCEDARTAELGKVRSRFALSLNLGFTNNKSTAGFANLLTEIPDRNEVGDLRTPLYTAQGKGTGQFLDACGRYRFGESWGVQGCGFYEQYKIRSYGKQNPSAGMGISYDSLASVEREDIVQMFGFSAAVFAELRMKQKHALIFGVGPRAGYVISKRGTYDYLTGTIFKATQTTEATGPEGILTSVQGFLEYEYRLGGAINALRLGTSMDAQSQSAVYIGLEF